MKYLLIILALTFCLAVTAQDKWDLRRCIEYATQNNISVKQAVVQARVSDLQLKQAKYNIYPTANFSTNLGGQFGYSIDPTTNQFTDNQLLSQNYSLSGNMTLYNWGRIRYALESQKSNTKGAYYDVEKAINDISLNVANAYLLVLSSREQIKVAEVQVFQTSKQLEITRKQYAAGTVPELNVLQLESNLTTDSSSLISAKANYDVNILTLKSFLNLDAAAPFELDTPDVDKIPVESFADLQPDVVYQLALQTQPQQKSNLVKVKGALDAIKSNKAALYPTIAAGYSLSSNFANYLRVIDPSSYVQHTPTATGLFVNYAGSSYDVLQPTYTYNYKALPLGYWFQGYNSQLGNNFTQRIGVGITVPIFNNGTTRITYENSKLNLRNLQLQSEQADYTLKQNIYTAYSNAVASFQKFTAGKKNVETTQKAYNVALRRYEIGLLGILDMITNQNNLTTAKLNLIANEYDYIFKMKLLEFYKGNGIKL